MAFYNERNIIVGAAAIYLSTEDSLAPAWPSAEVPAGTSGTSVTADLNASSDWRNVGYTSEGIEFSYSPDYGEVEVDQLLDAAKLFKQKMTATVATSFVESTLENLMVVWAQSANDYEGLPGSGSYRSGVTTGPNGIDNTALVAGEEHVGIAAGALGIEPIERQMVFVGGSPRVIGGTASGKKRERVYHLRRVLSVEASTHSLKRNEATMFPVTFRLLPASISGAEYGSIRDRVITSV